MDSICLLENAGIDFDLLNKKGIVNSLFAEYFVPSGLILNDNVNWITFHGIYDFAYLLRLVSNQPLHNDEKIFFSELETYFPNYFDTRYLLSKNSWIKGSLTKIASDLDIDRVGAIHQAGSDSLVTSKLFNKIIESFPELDFDLEKNKLYGFDNAFPERYYQFNLSIVNGSKNSSIQKPSNSDFNFYNNNIINKLDTSFPSKFNSNFPVNNISASNPALVNNGFVQNSMNYYNNLPYYSNNKNGYIINNNNMNTIYPQNNSNNMIYYNVANKQNYNIMVNNNNGKKLSNVNNQILDYNNNVNINPYYLKTDMKKGNISQFYSKISNNIASI